MRTRLISALLAAATLTVVAACATEKPPAVEPPIDPGFRAGDIRAFRLPLDAYRLTPEQSRDFQRARLTLVRRCMNRFGFDYPLPPILPEFLAPNEKRYTLADPRRAATVGYHDPEADERSRTIGADQAMSSAEEAVLNGLTGTAAGRPVPKGGCNATAFAQLGAEAEENLVETLSHAAYAKGMADSRTVRAHARWSACMRARGYDYADPFASNDDPRFATPAPTRVEIAVATADVACKTGIGYYDLRAALETAYQRREIEANRAALETIKTRNAALLRRVAEVNAA
ncbi:hypothetical protein BJY16_002525 [Actinoplanes octamycinicus]|uniref:Uncharacterized protein n=1 Tax=Actinoplanes octamycinicus TaxID=135948 RepID=A0A7W7M6U4_9ACTN|nr:hypothetical protein [Actinoplanes octamycinicus]MBB4739066.1 hypothetical protein [Actinoplanes octamycinicus]GIE60197.1 hypothetical protein Aoc01nite_55990 [Actinoplanes octamycinicus]